MKRAIIIVLDGVGIGAMPDAHLYQDEGSNTLGNIFAKKPDLLLPNLIALGLGNIDGTQIPCKTENPQGAFCKMAEKSAGKDTTTGHWEMAGLVLDQPFPTFHSGFPPEIIQAFEASIGRKTLANYAASGTQIINDLGDEHVRSGCPIVYTSADSVFQVAAHEEVIPVEQLYEMCQTARDILTGNFAVSRVIARPFEGKGPYTRTKNRKDFSLAPFQDTLLDCVKNQGMTVAAVGKIEDIFAFQGITDSVHTTDNLSGLEATLAYIKEDFSGLIFTNLVDFDMLYGHRNDVDGFAKGLVEFDNFLPKLINALKPDDILCITADHGCDPTTKSTDHSREYVPLLITGRHIRKGINLGIRSSFADLGKTIASHLGLRENLAGKSFLNEIST